MQRMAARFIALVRARRVADLDPWLAECRAGPVLALRNLAASLGQEGDAIRAAVTLPWSTWAVEGHITKPKLIKRSA
jgi:transposase